MKRKIISVILIMLFVFSLFPFFPQYRVEAANSSTISSPKSLKAVSYSQGGIKLSWDNVSGAQDYFIYRSTSKNGGYKIIKVVKTTTFINRSVTVGKCYYFKLKARKTIGNVKYQSAFSNIVYGTAKKPVLYYVVPNVYNNTETQAVTKLKNFQVVKTYANSTTIVINMVIGTDLVTGSKHKKGSKITLIISKGPSPTPSPSPTPTPTSTPTSTPTPTVYKSTVLFAPGIDSSVVSQKTIDAIKSILDRGGLASATISSTIRTSLSQATIMYNNIVNTSPETQKSIYGDAGDQVIDVYIAGKNAAKTKTQIIQDMVNRIETLWPTRVSNHCVKPADYALVNVIDIGYSSVSDIQIFRVQAIWARDNGIIKTFLDEPSNSCFHIEVQN